ncbi:MAG: hypothetical protein P4L53_19265 [Candidatus Obscuribacterales bacterium]|nr:hypothetical protein [Candidatus Obscuribacterales bacterium]
MPDIGKHPSFYLSHLICSAIFCCTTLLVLPVHAEQIEPGIKKDKMIQGAVSHNEVIDELTRLGLNCGVRTGKAPILQVLDVHLATPAFNAGVEKDDLITGIASGDGFYRLKIDRSGKIYQVELRSARARLDKQPVLAVTQPKIPVLDVNQKRGPVLDVNESLNKENNENLQNYDVEVIIDISGSMNEHDGTGNLSKFEWCREQVRSLAEKLSKYNRTVTVTVFHDDYKTYENCDPSKIIEVFSETTPSGWTGLLDPLEARLNVGLYGHPPGGRPLLIAILHDGLPNIPRDTKTVDQAIVSFTNKLQSPNQVRLTFLQIGDTYDGRDFCKNLDDNLVNEGAQFDIVDTKTFAELKQIGLTKAIIDALLESLDDKMPGRAYKPNTKAPSASSANSANSAGPQKRKELDDDAARMRQTRYQMEKELLGP